MLVGFGEVVKSLEERELYIINFSTPPQKVIFPYLKEYAGNKGKQIVKYFHSILPDWDRETIGKIVEKGGALLVGVHYIYQVRKRNEINEKFEDYMRNGKILVISDSLSLNTINPVSKSGAYYQYLANKRVLKNSPSKHYSRVEAIIRALEELYDVEKIKNIQINGKNLDPRIGLAVGHYWDNPDKTNPEFEHNKFLKEQVEKLGIKKYEPNLEKRIRGDLGILDNIGICLNFYPEEVKRPEEVIKEAKEELLINDNFAKIFISPLFGNKTLRMMVNDLTGKINSLEENLKEVVKLGNRVFETWRKEIHERKKLIENVGGDKILKFMAGNWGFYSVDVKGDLMKFLNLILMLPDCSCLAVRSPRYIRKTYFTGKISFALTTKPYEHENGGIPPAFLASFGSARLRGMGNGDVTKGYVLTRYEDASPLYFPFTIESLREEKASGMRNLSYKLAYQAWYENKIAIGCGTNDKGYLINVAIPPILIKEVGKSFLTLEDLEEMGIIKPIKIKEHLYIPQDKIKESLESVKQYFSKYGKVIIITDFTIRI